MERKPNLLLSAACGGASAIMMALAIKQHTLGTEAYNLTLQRKTIINQYPLAFSILWGGVALHHLRPTVQDLLGAEDFLLKGLGPMEREPYSPRPTPRVDCDVITGLPNHRATPERSAQILAELATREKESAASANSAPWCGSRPGCWELADMVSLRQPAAPLADDFKVRLSGLILDGSYHEFASQFDDDEDDEGLLSR